jgi:hypothetical protein
VSRELRAPECDGFSLPFSTSCVLYRAEFRFASAYSRQFVALLCAEPQIPVATMCARARNRYNKGRAIEHKAESGACQEKSEVKDERYKFEGRRGADSRPFTIARLQ